MSDSFQEYMLFLPFRYLNVSFVLFGVEKEVKVRHIQGMFYLTLSMQLRKCVSTKIGVRGTIEIITRF